MNLILLWHRLERRTGPLLGPSERRGLLRLCVAGAAAALLALLARMWLESVIGGTGLLRLVAVLLGTLLAGGVPYLLIARKPPTHAPRPETR